LADVTTTSAQGERRDDHGRSGMAGLGALFGLLYFVQGIVEPTEGLLSQPIKSLLRHWDYSAASAAWVMSALTLPWTIKPLYGLLTDFVPLKGSHRRSYLLITTAAATIGMVVIYILPLSADAALLLLIMLLPAALAIAFSDVVVDALMVQTGQPQGLTGRLQSIQWASIYAATILTGVTGGALSQWGMQQAGFLIAGTFCGVSFLAVYFLVREPPRPTGTSEASASVRTQAGRAVGEMWATFRQPAILTIGAFLFMWNFNPFSMTVLYYYSTETLHFDEQFAGSLTSYQAIGAVLGSVLYGLVCRAIPVRWLVHASIVTGILATLAYWGYRDAASAVHVSLVVGLIYMFGTLVQLDLAARVCRPQTAGTTFALLMSLINLSALLSQGLGGTLYETMTQHRGSHVAFQILVGIGALFTSGCWLLLPLMRRTLFPRVEQGSAEAHGRPAAA
jgi:MFS family permease